MYRRTAFAVGRAERIRQPCDYLEAKERELNMHWYALAISVIMGKSPDKAMLYMEVAPPRNDVPAKPRKPKRTELQAAVGCKLYILTKICGMKAADAGQLDGLEDWAVRYAVQKFKENGGTKHEK